MNNEQAALLVIGFLIAGGFVLVACVIWKAVILLLWIGLGVYYSVRCVRRNREGTAVKAFIRSIKKYFLRVRPKDFRRALRDLLGIA